MSKKKKNIIGVVYSTNPDFSYTYSKTEDQATLEPKAQNLRVSLDKHKRAGKLVTLVEGFIGQTDDLKELSKILKTLCGVGGSLKEGTIIIQGDFVDKISDYLKQRYYKVKIKK